jgi:hypothetical protein
VAETAVNLTDAINRTRSFDGPDPQTAGDGHNCNATFYGYIEVEWIGPGRKGNSITMSDTSAALTTTAGLTGGTTKARVYRSERAANGILCTESNASALTCADFTDDEGTSAYINQTKWFITDRIRLDNDRRIKIGKVIEWADPNLTFMVELEEPKKNNRSIKGIYNDTEY